ncbi:MAG TPA: L,D-transpeptidase [Trichocoleus sp.]
MIEFQFLKRPLTLFSLTWTFWLYASPQTWLQLGPANPPARFTQIVAQSANTLIPAKPFAKAVASLSPPRSTQQKVVKNTATQASSSLSRWQKAVNATAQSAVEPVAEPNRLEIDLSNRTVSIYKKNIRTRTYPVAIGRQGWETPEGQFRVSQMLEKPSWINPFTDALVPGGAPENPLGSHWIGFWTNGRDWLGFHGTSSPGSIGQAVSHGCVRMHNADIEQIFYQVGLGTQVIVKQ